MSTVESPFVMRAMKSLTRRMGLLSPISVPSASTSARRRWFSARRESSFNRFSSVTAAMRETELTK
jgi:hypothetical protein